MSRPAVLGAGIGASDTNNPEAAIVVYVDKTAAAQLQLPAQIDGVAVRLWRPIRLSPFDVAASGAIIRAENAFD